ncbi:hypothetical protein CAOG_08663 [Capsaspora owczarzaki ATCC 30864]|uniref:SET domain-containing protein n=1 Tax=Capsaspora owczarzaki (strain ATCC 30864) TaxID=595528 RepID=A0A0D2VNV0_CAPO3|nr:hypothetical protein CAOG_08663 [Capsaspora owczarzaki ATCC 30864]KJE92047.1 hypothetical protein CAOG_008663 [Capsaspora owczarzaki ATCC 30864]|eukprot:XP_011270274.1 hypothetical protein CAOG_08663 [Capsaspora owczarzaki ATCC 30864]
MAEDSTVESAIAAAALADSHKKEGNALYHAQDYVGAVLKYQAAVDAGPPREALPMLYQNMSAAKYQLKQYAESIEDATKAIMIDPTFLKAHLRRGKALAALGNWHQARNAYAAAIAVTPNSTEAQIGRIEAEQALVAQYYKPYNETMTNAQVRYINPTRGKGVVTLKELQYGTEVFHEAPVVSHRFVGAEENSAIPACSHCLQTRLTPDMMGPFAVLHSEVYPSGTPSFLSCEKCFVPYEQYCSAKCRTQAWDDYHSVFCAKDRELAKIHPITELYALCRKHNRTNPLIIARAFAMSLTGVTSGRFSNMQDTFQRFGNFIASEEQTPHDAEEFALILNAFSPPHRKLMEIVLTIQNFRMLDGAIMRNAQRLNPVSDLHAMIDRLAQIDAHKLAAVLGKIGFKIPQLPGLRMSTPMRSLTVSGSGLFEIGNTMNHSCQPNVVSMTRATDFTLSVVAVATIPVNTEVCISYIDTDLPKAKRQAALEELYYFSCSCAKCQSED